MPAKKIWSWGVDAEGLGVAQCSLDNNSAYVEIQAGLFRNQETYAFLEPRQTIAFTEYWMPARETGEFRVATSRWVVHLERKDGALHLALNVNRKIREARVRVLNGYDVVLSQRLDLSPESTWKKQLQLGDTNIEYKFELSDEQRRGAALATARRDDRQPFSEIRVAPEPSYAMPEEAERSPDDWLQLGINAEMNGELLGRRECLSRWAEKVSR